MVPARPRRAGIPTERITASGRGYGTSGKKKRPNGGNKTQRPMTRGPGMDEIVKGEVPPDPAAEIEAKRSDFPAEDLPPDAAEIRKRREG